jgi:hypothetical protein
MLNIPDRHKRALVTLANLTAESFDDLVRAIERAQPAISPLTLADRLPDSVRIPRNDLRGIVLLLVALYMVRIRRTASSEQIAGDVIESAIESKLDGFEPGSATVDRVRGRLTALLVPSRALEVTASANEVLTEHKYPLVAARILSDIRTIFSIGDEPEPRAAVIVHNLKLVTYTDGREISHFIALDSQDLRMLQATIERAIKKEAALKKAVEQSGLQYVEVQR